MARPIKKGIPYFPLDVDFLSDIKVKKIIRGCGANAVAVLISLLANIYRDSGYYVGWDDDIAFIISDEVGVSEGSVREIVQKAIQVDFFNKTLFDEFQILTSKGIQERYRTATYQRKDNSINKQYDLTNVEQVNKKDIKPQVSYSHEKLTHNKVNHAESTQSKVNETKEDIESESKKEESPPATNKFISLEIWQQNYGFPNAIVTEDMRNLAEEVGDTIVAEAIRETARREINGKGTWKYVERIVDNWKKLDLKTLDEVHEYQARWEKEQEQKHANVQNKRVTRKETKPEWAEQDMTSVEEKPLDEATQREIDERIAKLRANKPGKEVTA